jgi:hypothetical protein
MDHSEGTHSPFLLFISYQCECCPLPIDVFFHAPPAAPVLTTTCPPYRRCFRALRLLLTFLYLLSTPTFLYFLRLRLGFLYTCSAPWRPLLLARPPTSDITTATATPVLSLRVRDLLPLRTSSTTCPSPSPLTPTCSLVITANAASIASTRPSPAALALATTTCPAPPPMSLPSFLRSSPTFWFSSLLLSALHLPNYFAPAFARCQCCWGYNLVFSIASIESCVCIVRIACVVCLLRVL